MQMWKQLVHNLLPPSWFGNMFQNATLLAAKQNTSSTGMKEHGINMSFPPIVLQSQNSPTIDYKRQL